jgi:hypothetical protein
MARELHDRIPPFTLHKWQRFVTSTRLSSSQSAATRADRVRLAVHACGRVCRAYTDCSAGTQRLRLLSSPSSLAMHGSLTVGQERSFPSGSAPASETWAKEFCLREQAASTRVRDSERPRTIATTHMDYVLPPPAMPAGVGVSCSRRYPALPASGRLDCHETTTRTATRRTATRLLLPGSAAMSTTGATTPTAAV